jgi:hypothetical protein
MLGKSPTMSSAGSRTQDVSPVSNVHPIGQAGGVMGRLIRSVAHRLAVRKPRSDPRDARRDALCSTATLIGGLLLSRSVDDDVLAQEILHEVTVDFPALHQRLLEIGRERGGPFPGDETDAEAIAAVLQGFMDESGD